MQLEQIRSLILQHARLPVAAESVTFTSDLYEAGLTSLTTVHLMLALEDAFDVEFPDRLLSRKTFDSVQSIAEAIEEIRASA